YTFDLESNTVNRITKEDGLLSNNISDIYYQDGILFVQSGQGINLIKDGKIRSITEEDGLFMTSYNKNSVHQIDSANIVLSGSDGLYQFDYRDLYEIDASNEIKLFKVIGYDKFNNPYPIQIVDNKIQIDYQITSLLFDVYIGNHYKSDNNRFYYSINNDPYNANINGNQIVISSLPYYGSELSIYLVDANGNRSLNEIEIAITNKPPFWFSYQALLLYIIALIGIYWLIQKRRVEKAKDEFEKERRDKELNEARDLQQSLLPKITPKTTIFDISTYLQSANEMGGDYFDFIEFEDKLYSICGDATGHGVTSGIMVSVTKAGLNGVELNSPSTMLGKLNTIVKKVNFGRIRMSLSVVKLEENSIEISSAAMPPYFIYSAKNKKLNEVLIPNLPLGGLSLTQYESNKHDFEVGDILVMMSDGLPELPNESNELLDYEAIYNEIFDNIDKSAKQISNALLGLGKKWRTHLDDLPDDITLVVIKKVA
ncbi:MAG: SpoIIE family protein phosphatase, partial [Balneolaceae bacterium]|nr:SpoIIE family protein phosphatase [Balneolaceae bacterium]